MRDPKFDTESEMAEHYGYWSEHPKYPAKDWEFEVEEQATRKGYWLWVWDQIQSC